MKEYKDVVKARLVSLLGEVEAFDSEFNSIAKQLDECNVKVRLAKKSGSDYSDVKKELVDSQVLFFKQDFIATQSKHSRSSVYETFIQLNLLGIKITDLGIDEESVKKLEQVIDSASPLYQVVKGEVEIGNKDLHNDLFKAIEKNVTSEDNIKALYERVPK